MSRGALGFVLQSTYRVRGGKTVLVLHGVLAGGESFVARDDRSPPFFFVAAADAAQARRLGATGQAPSERTTMAGAPLVRVEVAQPSAVPPLRDALHRAGIGTYEADVRYALRTLIDRGIRGSLRIAGEGVAHATAGARKCLVFDRPELHPADWTPQLRVLSLDIETDPRARRVLSVGLYGCGAALVLLLDPERRVASPGVESLPSEAALLRALERRLRAIDPDVIVGWNVADFDFEVLVRRAHALSLRFEPGRAPGAVLVRRGRSARQATEVQIPGRVVLDGPTLLRSSFVRLERMGLDFVAQKMLGEGKSLGGADRAETIFEWWRRDPARLCEYNLRDARLALEVLEKTQVIELALERSTLTGMPIDRVSASVASFDFLYLHELGNRGLAAPSVGHPASPDRERFPPMAGGTVLRSKAGLYRNVLVLDFRSLYPNIIRTFEIDPLGAARAGEDAIVAPNGARFDRRRGVLPRLLDELIPKRLAAQQRGEANASQAIKILMNSFYGVLGTPGCRFFDPQLANAITGFGHALLLFCRDRLEERGHPVLYGDTDSLFVLSQREVAPARALGQRLAEELTAELGRFVAATWRVDSRLELQFERLFLRLLLPHARGGEEGASKRYAGLVDDGGANPGAGTGKGTVTFTGLEAVRRDWTELARSAQRELYERLFRDQPVDECLRDLVSRLRAGELDAALVYRKALRKPAPDYVTTTPPHVVAARRQGARAGDLVSYVVTAAGPEPGEQRQHPLDYQHYVDRQLRPVAEPVLAVLGLEFDRVIGDDRQLVLF